MVCLTIVVYIMRQRFMGEEHRAKSRSRLRSISNTDMDSKPCRACHNAKQPCYFEEGQTHCARCKRIGLDCAPFLQVKRARSVEVESWLAEEASSTSSLREPQTAARDPTQGPTARGHGPPALQCSVHTVSAEASNDIHGPRHYTLAELHAQLAEACNARSTQVSSPQPDDLHGTRPAAPRRKPSSRLLIPQPAKDGGKAVSPRRPTGPEIHAASSLLFYLPQCDFSPTKP
mmetsp:Transcript_27968/g.46484  ORF Transcript_27968/g.46484 Transcript_27968/m.46484 type:complete len:231 (-) Transcript_27968:69-761(-)